MADKRPLFTFITAVFNEEKTIRETVESVTNQISDDYEYIIIDDGSTDNTPYIVDEMSKTNKKIRVIHQQNQWVYPSFNNGIREATGEYIFIINADDTMELDVMPQVTRIIHDYKPDIIYGLFKVNICDGGHNILKENIYKKNQEASDMVLNSKREYYEFLPELIAKGYFSGQTSFYKTDFAKKILYRENFFNADVVFNIDFMSAISNAYVIGRPIYNHYKYNDKRNISEKYFTDMHVEQNVIYYHLKESVENKFYTERVKNAICNYRLRGLTYEYRRLNANNCPLSPSEKIRYMFIDSIDDCIKEIVVELNDREQFEARVLSAARVLLCENEIEEDDEMYFVYELLESLLRYEKDEEDINKIYSAIYNKNNPEKIGLTFYKKIIKGNNQREKI